MSDECCMIIGCMPCNYFATEPYNCMLELYPTFLRAASISGMSCLFRQPGTSYI